MTVFGATPSLTLASAKVGKPPTAADFRTIKDGPSSNPDLTFVCARNHPVVDYPAIRQV